MKTLLQMAALGTMQFYRRLYIAAVAHALATGLQPDTLATDVCDLAREAGVLVGKGNA